MSEPNPARLLLLSPTTAYRVEDVLKAVDLLNTPVAPIVASEKRSAMEHALVRVTVNQPDKALAQIDALHAEAPLDAIVSVDQRAPGWPQKPLVASACAVTTLATVTPLPEGVSCPDFSKRKLDRA